MNVLLILVTAVSLISAATLLVLHWRLIREERRRSAARVEALLDAVAKLSGAAPPDPAPPIGATPAFAQIPLRQREDERSTNVKEPASPHDLASAEVKRDVAPATVASHDLFHDAAEARPGFGRLLVPVSAGVMIVTLILSGLLIWNHRAASATPVTGVAAAGESAAPTPLELISLRHQRVREGLAISGLVRNPASGHLVSGLTVVVLLFDRTGSLATTATAPLDFRTLAPGEESPFTISLDNVGAVGRYRVSFRADDKVVPHVDRRQDSTAATAARTHEVTERPYGT